MAYTKLNPRHSRDATVEEISHDDSNKVYRLSIPAGPAGNYRLAQLDDYTKSKRGGFPWQFPIGLSLSARTSSNSIPGTWGFGLWNDPFGLSLGFGGDVLRLPALPNAVWFFGASKESYLSFQTPRAERNEVETTLAQGAHPPALRAGASVSWRTVPGSAGERTLQTRSSLHDLDSTSDRASTTSRATNALLSAQREVAANGFLAQVFRSPKFHPLLIPAGLALPLSRKATRRLLGKVVVEDGIRLSLDVTQWHRYRLDWREERVSFEIDGLQVFESLVSPNPPLGLVIWVDNQYAAFTPEGKIGFGVLENPEPVWLEIKDIEIA